MGWITKSDCMSVTDLNQTFRYIDLSQFYDSGAQIQTIFVYITEVYRLITLAGSLRYLITLLKYTLLFYNVELNTN